MIRVVVYLVLLAALAYGGVLLVQNPGHVTVNWHGEVVEAPAALLIGAVALAAIVLWSLFRFIVGMPSFVRFAARQRKREKGYAALSRGLIAVGSGDGRAAGHAAHQADKHLRNDPLAIMLRAQAAHMSGDAHKANAAYEALSQRDDTRVLGLRGLHAEAARRGDDEAARHFAEEAHRAGPLPWSAQAVLEHRASEGDWEKALATVETSLAARLIDKATAERQRAVLETAIAYDKEAVAPDAALALARSAMHRARDLAPAVVLAARLLARRGEIRKASKLIEKAWPRVQHPEIAEAYLDVRPGDSTQDRLTRAQKLMAITTFDPVSRLAAARAALANKAFGAAREAMAPLVAEGKHPTADQCMLMAELDEAEYGDLGLWREWLARASRAPLDPAWVCDGIVYDHWAPASPATGRLDAFQWQVPAERLDAAIEAMPAPARRPDRLARPESAVLEHHDAEPAPEAAVLPAAPVPPAAAAPAPVPVAPRDPPKIEEQKIVAQKIVPPPPATRAESRNSSAPPPLFHRRLTEDDAARSAGNGADVSAEPALPEPPVPGAEASDVKGPTPGNRPH